MRDAFVMRRTAEGLAPVGDEAVERLAKIKPDQRVMVSIVRSRSVDQHRYFWAMLTKVAEATQFETPERLLAAIKLALGRYDLMKLPNGKVVPVLNSISFDAMPQAEFQAFMDDAVKLIDRDVLPGSSIEEVMGMAA